MALIGTALLDMHSRTQTAKRCRESAFVLERVCE